MVDALAHDPLTAWPMARYGVYFAPAPGSPHARIGHGWLGRDAHTGTALDVPALPGVAPARRAALTASARRYGLHATLKPPFVLADGCDVAALDQALRALAAGLTPCACETRVALLDGFLVWRPVGDEAALADIAARCVTGLDRFRRPADEAERTRRRAAGLSPVEEANLLRWGYPYVLDAFRFHLTLTDRLPAELLAAFQPALEAASAPLRGQPLVCDALTLFGEPAPGADFVALRRYGFDGSVDDTPVARSHGGARRDIP